MAINLLDVIRDDSAIKLGGFTGAIFLTYALNLTFFEQILAPALDQAGCSNVLILADPDGYQQAMEMGAKSIQGAGLRYVCTPVSRKGQGVQHAKMLFMVGPNRGRLLIGSGNLTFHGYGRNLELYSHFEYDLSDTSADIAPFFETWKLIQYLVNDSGLSAAARQQIRAIQESVTWLKNSSPISGSTVWHNYDRPLLEQLNQWRMMNGFVEPAKKIIAISPYYDQHLSAVKQLATDASPAKLQIHLDPNFTNLDGKKAAQEWRGRSPKLTVFAIGPNENGGSRRHIHAKAIAGLEKNGAWCISGSANLSHPALLSSWQAGGNLELVTFHWSENQEAFDYLLKDEMIQTWSIDLLDVTATESEPSEREVTQQTEVFLTDLSLQGERIEGKISSSLPNTIQGVNLHLQRKKVDIPVSFQDETTFLTYLRAPLDEAESARLEAKNFTTSYRWIDQPDVLARFGARTYQVRIKGKLETLLGAENLFHELMNFLWERVEPDNDQAEHDPRLHRRHLRKGSHQDEEPGNEPPPPGPEAFITEEELVHIIQSGIDHHPYDRSLLSLRDLLSLVLLRLTVSTQPVSLEDQDLRDEEQEQKKQAEQEELQINALVRLRDYLLHYCNRYANRLVDIEFIRKTSPELIFQNHYTLGRVLLEFSNKASNVYSHEDFFRCFWLLWGPLVWPSIIGRDGSQTLKILMKEFQQERVQEAWQKMSIPSLAKVMFSEVLGQVLSWRAGFWDAEKVETFMVAREWINRIKQVIGEKAILSEPSDFTDVIGIPTISDLFSTPAISTSYLEYLHMTFAKIQNYRSPAEERYAPLIDFQRLGIVDTSNEDEKQRLIEQIRVQGLEKEFEAFKKTPVPIMATSIIDGVIYCPKCGANQAKVAQQSIERGGLVLCSYSDAWMYLEPNIPQQII